MDPIQFVTSVSIKTELELELICYLLSTEKKKKEGFLIEENISASTNVFIRPS